MSVNRVTDKHDPKQGVGMSFEYMDSYYDKDDDKWKEKLIRVTTICEEPREVTLEVSTFVGLVGHARHYFVSLRVSSLSAKPDNPEDRVSTYSFTSNTFPEETKGFVHRVRFKCKRDETDYCMVSGERYTRFHKGDMIEAFDNEEEALKRAVEDFEKYFGDGWILMDRYGEKIEH